MCRLNAAVIELQIERACQLFAPSCLLLCECAQRTCAQRLKHTYGQCKCSTVNVVTQHFRIPCAHAHLQEQEPDEDEDAPQGSEKCRLDPTCISLLSRRLAGLTSLTWKVCFLVLCAVSDCQCTQQGTVMCAVSDCVSVHSKVQQSAGVQMQ